ncbi:MAG: GAF domain-containing protein [Anaerolineaceae bacterium]|jgi:signal transduction histidine kinase|nr:GAF domain-containing protein [Anaerolineaceae bacterium]
MIPLTREQLEERLVALHRASLDLVRIKDIPLEKLLERIGVEACKQADANFAAVGVIDENLKLEQFIPVGMMEGTIQRLERSQQDECVIHTFLKNPAPVRIDKMPDDLRDFGSPDCVPGVNTFLAVPIQLGENQLGQIYLTDKKENQGFTLDDQQVIETLAAYAAIAIANTRLYKERVERDHILTRRNENLALLNELVSTLASSTNIDEILDRSLIQVMDYLQLEAGEIYLRQGDSNILRLARHRGTTVQRLWNENSFKFGQGIVGSIAQDGQSQHILLSGKNVEGISEEALANGFYQMACCPLNGRQGVLGVLCVATCDQRLLDEMEMQFLSALSSWVGTAIENVQVNLQQRRIAVLEERERIGMDLHDGVIQSIYAVGLVLEHARLLMDEEPGRAQTRIEHAIDDLNSTIRDIRSYILDLRPHQLHDEDLMLGIKRLVIEFRANTLVNTVVQAPTGELGTLSGERATVLFHICQEALANIAKHAQAMNVEVCLWATNERILLEIRDDGKGFDLNQVKFTLGHGLPNMQTRARNVGGDIDISTEPGKGTSILVWVPSSSEG